MREPTTPVQRALAQAILEDSVRSRSDRKIAIDDPTNYRSVPTSGSNNMCSFHTIAQFLLFYNHINRPESPISNTFETMVHNCCDPQVFGETFYTDFIERLQGLSQQYQQRLLGWLLKYCYCYQENNLHILNTPVQMGEDEVFEWISTALKINVLEIRHTSISGQTMNSFREIIPNGRLEDADDTLILFLNGTGGGMATGSYDVCDEPLTIVTDHIDAFLQQRRMDDGHVELFSIDDLLGFCIDQYHQVHGVGKNMAFVHKEIWWAPDHSFHLSTQDAPNSLSNFRVKFFDYANRARMANEKFRIDCLPVWQNKSPQFSDEQCQIFRDDVGFVTTSWRVFTDEDKTLLETHLNIQKLKRGNRYSISETSMRVNQAFGHFELVVRTNGVQNPFPPGRQGFGYYNPFGNWDSVLRYIDTGNVPQLPERYSSFSLFGDLPVKTSDVDSELMSQVDEIRQYIEVLKRDIQKLDEESALSDLYEYLICQVHILHNCAILSSSTTRGLSAKQKEVYSEQFQATRQGITRFLHRVLNDPQHPLYAPLHEMDSIKQIVLNIVLILSVVGGIALAIDLAVHERQTIFKLPTNKQQVIAACYQRVHHEEQAASTP